MIHAAELVYYLIIYKNEMNEISYNFNLLSTTISVFLKRQTPSGWTTIAITEIGLFQARWLLKHYILLDLRAKFCKPNL